ncbi:MAG: alpha/beta hydrolase [Geminicoccaceae bacterium]
MPLHAIDRANGLFHEHHAASAGKPTFVFFNALSGNLGMWRASIAPALEADGFGTLLWNYRGQQDSPVDDRTEISARQIADDGMALLDALRPARPVYVGMSIGGLFALDAHLGGRRAAAMLLINTLRIDSPRLRWVNAATHRAALVGGGRLLRDLYGPLVFGERFQEAHFPTMLAPEPYEPLSPAHVDARLLAAGATADWAVDYESVEVPVTILTGLQDRVFYDEQVVDRLSRRFADARRVNVAEAAHMLPVETPDDVIGACRELAGRIA